jgi:hypothetical protein
MKKRAGEDDFEALARHTAWRIEALSPGGQQLEKTAYTNAAGVFDFAVLAANLGMTEDSLRLHFPSFEQRAIAGEISGGLGADFTALVEWHLNQP